MNYEQKYKEALETARKINSGEGVAAPPDWTICEVIFPELAESDDEKTRKELIQFIKNWKDPNNIGRPHDFPTLTRNVEQCDRYIAWLEKQPPVKFNDEKDEMIRKELLESFKYQQRESRTDKEWLNGIKLSEVVAWIEKQGKQKQDPCNVEPKFHRGEWIVHHGTENIYKVIAIVGNQYQLKYGDNYTIQKCADVDRCARLWDITKDAKDGDVLACENGWTCIFKCLNDNLFSSHCFMDNEGWFCEDGGQGHTLDERICGEIHPATKEQRDLLFQKMKEAGYEWDTETKELRKIKNSPILSNSSNTGKQWSEEDDYNVQCCTAKAESDIENGRIGRNKELINWLKSLKQRMEESK